MTSRVLFIGDPHFKVSNIPQVQVFITKIEKLVINTQPDLIVIAGDILHCHEKINTIPLNEAYHFITKMTKVCKTIILVGNHDYINNSQYLTENHWMNGLKPWNNIVIVDKPFELKHQNQTFIFVPYVPPGKFIQAMDEFNLDWKSADCIFAHQEFRGCEMGAIVSECGDVWDKQYPQIVSGHIHTYQVMNNIYYPGSAMQHNFGEMSKHIIPILTFRPCRQQPDTKSILKINEVDLKLPCKKVIYTDIKDIEQYRTLDTKGSLDTINLRISASNSQFKTFRKTALYKQLRKKNIKISYYTDTGTDLKLDMAINKSVGKRKIIKIIKDKVNQETNPYVKQYYTRVFKQEM